MAIHPLREAKLGASSHWSGRVLNITASLAKRAGQRGHGERQEPPQQIEAHDTQAREHEETKQYRLHEKSLQKVLRTSPAHPHKRERSQEKDQNSQPAGLDLRGDKTGSQRNKPRKHQTAQDRRPRN